MPSGIPDVVNMFISIKIDGTTYCNGILGVMDGHVRGLGVDH